MGILSQKINRPTRSEKLRTPVPTADKHRLSQADGSAWEFEGTLLGFGTSRRGSHQDHPPGVYPKPGARCSGCRWAEISIYRALDGTYVVHIVGRSDVPGERSRIRTIWAKDASAALDGLLVTRPRKFSPNGDSQLELPQPNHDALDDASKHDASLQAILRSWRSGDVV